MANAVAESQISRTNWSREKKKKKKNVQISRVKYESSSFEWNSSGPQGVRARFGNDPSPSRNHVISPVDY